MISIHKLRENNETGSNMPPPRARPFKVYTGIRYMWGILRTLVLADIAALHDCIQPELEEIAENVKKYKIVHRMTEHTGMGAFNGSDQTIPVGTPIGWYKGKICFGKNMKQNKYLITLQLRVLERKRHTIVIDGLDKKELKDVNNACIYNHSCNPNCTADAFCGPGRLQYVIMITRNPIQPGQELLWDYGSGYWNNRTVTNQLLAERGLAKKLTLCKCSGNAVCPKGRSCNFS